MPFGVQARLICIEPAGISFAQSSGMWSLAAPPDRGGVLALISFAFVLGLWLAITRGCNVFTRNPIGRLLALLPRLAQPRAIAFDSGLS